ncbi:uncharacterized protein J4E78_009284 [Alternaria triticimaculans]|uniref:uncharacterized protein n=1 Tax=Alternaria triticimaculans TaxID=297637 RepID=UPI0020C3C919|nr:uncharacterized protein J4E78_009284 [Alternaria triticimaculans]KAI4646362.1 hypothetical protein J4E78_009284 [Alternaria triticimaculans]
MTQGFIQSWSQETSDMRAATASNVKEFAYGIVFRDGIDPKVQVGIHNDLANRWDRTSVVDQFAFGRWDEARLPQGATGTQVYVREGWHQESEPHFTVELRFVYGTTGVHRHWATAHVYLDFSESVIKTCDKVDGRQRWCFVKPLWAEHHRVWDSRGPRPAVLPRPPRGMRYAPKYPPVWR